MGIHARFAFRAYIVIWRRKAMRIKTRIKTTVDHVAQLWDDVTLYWLPECVLLALLALVGVVLVVIAQRNAR